MPSIWTTSNPRSERSRGCRHFALGQANRTFELARRDVDQHLVHGPFAKPVFRHRSFPTGKSLLLAVEATKARAFNLHLAAVKALPFVLPQRCAVRFLPRACRGPHAVLASFSIISASASIPEARQKRSKLAVIFASASILTALAGIAVDVISLFMWLLSSRGISTPSLQAQGEQRRSSYFNNDRDIASRKSTSRNLMQKLYE